VGADTGRLEPQRAHGALALRALGRWDVASAAALDAALGGLRADGETRVDLDLGDVERMDTTGAWLVLRTIQGLQASGVEVALAGVRPEHRALLEAVAESYAPCETEPRQANAVLRLLGHAGVATAAAGRLALAFVGFLGEALVATGRTALRPWRLRLTSTVFHMEQVGLNALPIVVLLAFLIGVVMAYQGAVQLEQFGAREFVVDLLGISVLRELGVLLTSIVVAGRSGSAFTAQIGSMKVHEEIDAMRTLGLDPMEVLVLPRAIALVLTLPLLAFLADLAALLGGGLVAWLALDIGPVVFLERLRDTVTLTTFAIGVVKAPVFALLIALVGCYEGLQVRGSAESVGYHTTRAVVEAIFLVIVADACFSVLFTLVGL